MNRDARHTAFAIVAIVSLTVAGCATTPTSTSELPQVELDEGHPEPPSDTFERIDPPAVDPNLATRAATTLPTPALYLDDTFERRRPAERVEPYVELRSPVPPPEPLRPENVPMAHPPEPTESDQRTSELAEPGGRTSPTLATTPPPATPPSEAPVDDSSPESAVAGIETSTPRTGPRTTPPADPPHAEPSRARQDPVAPELWAPTARAPTARTPTARPATPPVAVEPTDRVSPVTESTDTRDASSAAGYAEFAWPTADDPRVVRPGSEISIVLPGTGWLYVGKEYGDGSVTLLGKSSVGGDEAFRFRISEPGDYGLWFQRQDPLAGTFTNERFALRADPSGETPEPGIAAGDAGGVAENGLSEGEPPDADDRTEEKLSLVEQARRLLDAGEETQAIARFSEALAQASVASSPRSGVVDEALARRFADVAARAPAPTAIVRDFWRGVASSGVLEAEAHRALLEIGIREGDIDAVLDAFLGLEHTNGLSGLGATVGMPDETLFELARRLERPGPHRDLPRALSLYRAIVDDRPLSRYWDDSRSRIEYLQRHYIDVR